MTVDDLSLDHDTVARQTAEARTPVDGYVSRQIGCSDLAPLLVAAMVCPPPDRLGVSAALADVERAMRGPERDWLVLGADRAAWACGMETVGRDAGPRVDASWSAEKGRAVRTPIGNVPEIVATKAGVRTKAASGWAASEGNRLEPLLLTKWMDLEETQDEIARLVTQHEALAAAQALTDSLYPAEWNLKERSKRIAHPECSEVVTYPDAWAWLWSGERGIVNAKCHYQRASHVSAPYVIQMQGELAITRSHVGLLPYGQGWTAKYGWKVPAEERPIETFRITPNPALGAALVAFSRVALAWISEVSTEWNEQKRKTA